MKASALIFKLHLFSCINNAAVLYNEKTYVLKTKHMMNKYYWLSKKLRLNASTVYLILLLSLRKVVFYIVCKTLSLYYSIPLLQV